MSSITLSANASDHPQLRAMNVFRDLPAVADLIEVCFSSTMDNDGQRYIADMRRASRDDSFLRWASHMTETASLPLTGFVWEENGSVVGNASLIPFRDNGKRIYLIANIAVHPDYRRRGIARILTRRAMQYGWDKKASALWLHVRDDNPGAIQLYSDLGFQEIARRTNWTAKPDIHLLKPYTDIEIAPRPAHFWPLQKDWLRRINPNHLDWYRSFNLNSLRPGFANWLYLLLVDMNIKQWVAVRNGEMLAALSWAPNGGRSESLMAATGERSDPEALTHLLIHARRVLANQSSLSLEHPANEMRDAFVEAGFKERRTLLWMRADPATQPRELRK
ncbi:MAG: GNAT family N-acetyltransferase [Anaerolineales bacterium]|nr:GNAT family N-acetyltransferase [Anaerolineales bacterium]